MHVQIVHFNLKDIDAKQYAQLCDQLAPAFAELPGLEAKIWLANPGTNTFGGAYLWADRQAMESFSKTDLFDSVVSHPGLAKFVSSDFDVLYGPTEVTRGISPLARSGSIGG